MSLQDIRNEASRHKEAYEESTRKFNSAIGSVLSNIRTYAYQLENQISSVNARDPQLAERMRELVRQINRELAKTVGVFF